SGGSSLFEGLSAKLASLLGMEVTTWDPFRKIIIPTGIDTQRLKDISAQLAVAVGLALRQ
ncbi:MAG: pilus assembly protein PilM, partial [Candidatus Omnitrophica bacterium]|nr:pilus assembly protein PilM [Candidatus Omnitrophota bacterium]